MRDATIQAIALSICIGLLVGAGFTLPEIQEQRDELGLVQSMEGAEGMPPHVALATAALGTFRGLAVDVLWFRADKLQSEGQYFEAQTLAQWITTLQPRFPAVWGFQAWNMAFNISAATQTEEERWKWVRSGIELLRDRAIPLNPDNPGLYEELSKIYFEKIADKRDRKHQYYKKQMAQEFGELLGDAGDGLTSRATIERFRPIAEAEPSLDALIAQDRNVSDLVDLIRKHGAEPDGALLRMIGRFVMFQVSVDGKILGYSSGRYVEGTNIELIEAIRAEPRLFQTLTKKLLPHMRKRVLMDEYRMDAQHMVKTMERYGPLDWRHPLAHALYWLDRGQAKADGLGSDRRADELALFRRRQLAIQDLAVGGRIEYDPVTQRLDYLPDTRFFRIYEFNIERAFAEMLSGRGMYDSNGEHATPDDLMPSYRKLLMVASVTMYLYGDEKQAQLYFVKLRALLGKLAQEKRPEDMNAIDLGWIRKGIHNMTLKQYIAEDLSAELNLNLENTRKFVDAMIRRGIVSGLAHSRHKVFHRYFALANDSYDRLYGEDAKMRVTLKESNIGTFKELVEGSFVRFFEQQSLPTIVLARVWRNTHPGLQASLWEKVGPQLRARAVRDKMHPRIAFPAPPGVKDDLLPDAKGKDPVKTPGGDAKPDKKGTSGGD